MKLANIKSDSNKLILAFLGYSFTPSCLKHLDTEDCGLSVVYDYTNLEFDASFLEGKEIYLLAWSMGVWAANLVLKDIAIKRAVAINGTPLGIDDKFGIPKEKFYETITNFDFESFKKFCFLGIKNEEISKFEFNPNAKLELANIYKFAKTKQESNISWDKVIISKKDFVFPTKACEYFECQKEFINAPHFPFFNFKNFGEIFEISR